MKRDIVIFERDERYTDSGMAELDFRLMRQSLPAGSSPLALADRDGFAVHCGQWFAKEEVKSFSEQQSGYVGA